MTKTKVLLIQNCIPHYSLPVYNILGKNVQIELTIAHFDPKQKSKEKEFEEIILHFWRFGSIFFSKENLYSICSQFEVVICMADLHWFSLMSLGLIKNRKFKLIYWGIGVSASYEHKFDQKRHWDFLRYYFMKGADALIFYSAYPLEKYIKHGFKREKLFVAHNTVVVNQTLKVSPQKDSILFIGTLYKKKGIFELLSAYKSAYFTSKNLPDLVIIGDGYEFDNIVSWIKVNDLNHKILMQGAIYDDVQLEQFFKKSIVCISPNQAGLSVLKSMGFGVPFITKFDSITGGERFNIINYETGIIYKNAEELANILCNIDHNKYKFIQMGENSQKFYNSFRRPDQMVQGFLDAIEFVNSI